MTACNPPTGPSMPSPRVFFVAALGLGGFFALWTWLVLSRHEISVCDGDCARYWCEQAAEERWGFIVFFTDLGSVAAMTLLTIVGALWQASLRNRLLVLGWIGVAIGGGLLNSGIKHAVGRDRPGMRDGQIVEPDLRDKAVLEINQSYPSGHSMGSAVGYGFLAYTLFLWQGCPWRRMLIGLATAAVIASIGFSRMYLRAHWLSDVVGGWSIGLCWLFFCLGCLELLRRRRTAGG